ncbi:MAG: HDOD domain-containing protein [Gammaproteobacteria bacterium]|nr:HDOD domain-containing protein [Gammaproteobacteria bacterium]MCW8982763.1 HDOD domain-containing protein [Gammaproteobacteria bacterium]
MEFDLAHLKQELSKAFKSGEIELPSMPNLLFKIRQSLYDKENSAAEVGQMMYLDPALAARVMRIANSSMYTGQQPVNDCQAAISRLGLSVIQNLVTGIVLRNAYSFKKNPKAQKLVKQAWQQSCRVGALSHVLASVTVGIRPDKAMLAGLIHNIGVLPLLNYILQFPKIEIEPRMLNQVVAGYQGKLGTMLLQKWQFDSEYLYIPELSGQPAYDSGSNELSLNDIVVVARMHLMQDKMEHQQFIERLSSMPSYQKMSISKLGPDASLQLIEEADEEIHRLMRGLS